MGCCPSKQKSKNVENENYYPETQIEHKTVKKSIEISTNESKEIKQNNEDNTKHNLEVNNDEHRRRTIGLESVQSLTELSSYSKIFPGVSKSFSVSHDSKTQPDNAAVSPSAGITSGSPKCKNLSTSNNLTSGNVEEVSLEGLLHVACSIKTKFPSDNCSLHKIKLHRSVALISNFEVAFVGLLSKVHHLLCLDLSGNNAGPVAVKALLYSILQCDTVESLDMSDNMANSQCTDAIMQLLLHSKHLYDLNLSCNHMGKASLSQKLSLGLQGNEVLVKLHVSSCGASNIQILFDGLKFGILNGKSTLQYLDVSNNESSDGLQLGLAIRSVLEHQSCNLKYLNIENTGLSPSGWNVVADGLKKNRSLNEFVAGGSSNQIQNIIKIADLLFSNKYLSTLNLKGIGLQEKFDRNDQTVIVDDISFSFDLINLNLAQCGLTDSFIASLAQAYAGKLPNLTFLDLSNNPDITANGAIYFDQLLTADDRNQFATIKLTGLTLENLAEYFANSSATLTAISLAKARVSTAELCKLFDIRQTLHELTLDGIKLSNTDVLSSLLSSNSHHRFTLLSLQGCYLTDKDLVPVVAAFKKSVSPVVTLVRFDLSNNRISNSFEDLVISLLFESRPLEYLNISHNAVCDIGACALAESIVTKNSLPKLKSLIISHNNLTKKGLLALVSTVASGIITLDVSSQTTEISEDDLEDIIEALTTALGFDPDQALHQVDQPLPVLSSSLSVNLTNLGGTAGPRTRLLDSVAIKTDYTKICKTSANLSDYILLAAGLTKTSAQSSSAGMFTAEQWNDIIGSDAPSWLNVASERKKCVYLTHLSGNATLQRLQGILETEADCLVSEIIFIKDPIFQKFSGAAWVLFEDEKSVSQAVEFYVQGSAQMFGIPFSISAVEVTVADTDQNLFVKSEKEKQQRLLQRKEQEEKDQDLLEASQRLAEERAAYRESHPAYQNGRIW